MACSDLLADFIAGYPHQDLPEEASKLAKMAVMDYIGVTLAGINEEAAVLVRRIVSSLGGRPQASIWGSPLRTSVTLAAMANASAAHALDFDDTNSVMIAHPSIQLLPGLFSIAEHMHYGGRAVLDAYIIGFEVGAKLGRAMNPGHIGRGWLPIGTLGPVMEAAACSRLLGLSSAQARMALGLATNLSSGIRCNNGTMAKPFLAGHGASNGIWAALLAREGVTSNPLALEDKFGFFENFSGGDPGKLEHEIGQIGLRFDIAESGISFKLYPCCAGAHGPIDCALELAGKYSPGIADIESITVSAHAALKIVLIHPRPRTVSESRFSLEYCVCRALIDGQMGPEQFSREKVDDPAVQTLMELVTPVYDSTPVAKEALGQNRLPVKVEIRLKDGKVLSATSEYARGTPKRPLSEDEIEGKFLLCCSHKLSQGHSGGLLEGVRNFENVADVNDIISRLNFRGAERSDLNPSDFPQD